MTAIATSSAVACPADGLPAVRVLYVTHRVPYPPDKGDRIRNFHLLRHMARRGRVWLASLADEEVAPGVADELHRLCERVQIVPVSRARWVRAGISVLAGRSVSEGAFDEPGLRRLVREWAGETTFTAAVASASSMAPYLKDLTLSGVPAVIDLVDVDSQKWADFADSARGPRRWLYRLEAARLRKLERQLPGWARAVAVVSRAEADVFDGFVGRPSATVAANGVDLDYFRPERSPPAPGPTGPRVPASPSCVFVGAMDYRPNVDAAVWFARTVWPEIRASFPTAEFRIVGRKPSPAVRRLAGLPGVTVVGQVADVRPDVAAATVAVIPLRLARGIQNKVLEALAMGKPVVAAPAALAALKAVPGCDLLMARTPREWVDGVSGLFADPARCLALGAAGRRFVEQHHHWEDCLEPLLSKVFAPAEGGRDPSRPALP